MSSNPWEAFEVLCEELLAQGVDEDEVAKECVRLIRGDKVLGFVETIACLRALQPYCKWMIVGLLVGNWLIAGYMQHKYGCGVQR